MSTPNPTHSNTRRKLDLQNIKKQLDIKAQAIIDEANAELKNSIAAGIGSVFTTFDRLVSRTVADEDDFRSLRIAERIANGAKKSCSTGATAKSSRKDGRGADIRENHRSRSRYMSARAIPVNVRRPGIDIRSRVDRRGVVRQQSYDQSPLRNRGAPSENNRGDPSENNRGAPSENNRGAPSENNRRAPSENNRTVDIVSSKPSPPGCSDTSSTPTEDDCLTSQVVFLKCQLREIHQHIQRSTDECKSKDDSLAEVDAMIGKVTEDNVVLRQLVSSMKGEIDSNTFVNGEARIRANDFESDAYRLKDELKLARMDNRKLVSGTKSIETRLHGTIKDLETSKMVICNLKSRHAEEFRQSTKEFESLRFENTKLEAQKGEVMAALVKQLELISLYKRQKMHIEAAKKVSICEEEFNDILKLTK